MSESHDSHHERKRIRAATLLFSAATAFSRVAGLVREMVTAAVFGSTTLYSAFVVANQIPNLLRSLVADSALSAAFVPVFSQLREEGDEERAWRIASAVCALIVVVLGPLTVLAMAFAPHVVQPFLDGTFSPEEIDLAVGLTRLLLPIVLILSLSGVTVGILNSYDRFGYAAFAPVAWNAVILVSLVIAHFFIAGDDNQLWFFAAGTLAGTLVQVAFPLPQMRGLGGRFSLRASWRDPKVREVFVLMLPVTISLGLINLQQLLSSFFAANVDASDLVNGLQAGAGPALLDKAFRIYMLPQGIFSVAVTTVIFPVLSRLAARKDARGFADSVDQGLRQILILLVPSSIFIGVFAEPITRVLYERGEFDSAQTTGVSLALIAFAVGLTFNGLSLLLIRSFFAMQATWVPTAVSGAQLAVNVVVAAASYRAGGVFAIALATSIANILGVLLLYALLQPRTAGLGTRRTLAVAGGTTLSAAVAVGLPFAGWFALEREVGHSSLVSGAAVAAALAVAAPIYLALGARMGVVPRGFLRQLRRNRRGGDAA